MISEKDEQRSRALELQSIAEKKSISINALGRELGYDESNFRRYARVGPTGRLAPDGLMFAARAFAGDTSIDAFIVGVGDTSEERYVIHTNAPRFIALMASRDRVSRIAMWIDNEPSAAATLALRKAAESASLRAYYRDYKAAKAEA